MCNGSIFKVFRKEVNMNLDDYKLLKLESKNGAKIPLFPWYIKKNGLLN
ncbi:hypothetical protein SY111_19270 [Ligilactobacillus agilis]|uniref:Uncharacterized protein n=1 Tax=Ligilactobacillus agilis TaxID=1601 RepID=A0A6F9XVJ8_9LACO|nr:hypothetical protein SY111_19270 [Ligilactobacillus agilis]